MGAESMGAGKPAEQVTLDPSPFDLYDNQHNIASNSSYLYERVGETVLGLEEGTNTSDLDSRRCFNCGSLDHIIASCPEPLNHALITLSRQLYKFFRNDTLGEFRRFYEVEECKQQRLRWLEEFEPGHIRGPSLREALALRDGDVGENVEWLRNMACWGYPTGWIGITDPREHVQKIISGDSHETNNYSEDDDNFVIVGDEDEEWLVLPTKLKESSSDNDRSGSDESLGPVSNTSSSRSTTPTACVLAQRWAVYPDTYFLWSRLPAYNGFSLPALGSEVNSPPVSSTYTPDRQELWNSIVSQHFIASARDNCSSRSFVGSYSISGCPQSASFPPVPPTTPPPLPPSSYHTRPPPGLDGTVPRSTHNVQDQVVDTEDDIDMDLSE
ncbi:hypothetical protein AcV5_006629 [Taiwanofungus camphoratus]|nr:hypothetical protein AcW2_005063 [Antrodia cinnamomea]KAI0934947.1 hypothetical protein AcV5_006629 [Antrodia cinnamomea]KAI0949764.1 hypothetical protein AcV7_008436 [Antrodia cinnamomea]